MLAKSVEAISRKLEKLWRASGSPRIAGGEKVVLAVRAAWADREDEGGEAGNRTRHLVIVGAVAGVLVAILVVWLVIAGFGDDGRLGGPAGRHLLRHSKGLNT